MTTQLVLVSLLDLLKQSTEVGQASTLPGERRLDLGAIIARRPKSTSWLGSTPGKKPGGLEWAGTAPWFLVRTGNSWLSSQPYCVRRSHPPPGAYPCTLCNAGVRS